MRVLLDTCVLSALHRPHPNQDVQEAVQAILNENLYISVLSIGEIAKGIALLDDSLRKQKLSKWLQDLETHYNQRVLTPDAETCYIWGERTAEQKRQGRILPVIDGLIAATACRYGLHLMTRNISDFQGTGVLLLNPWGTADFCA